MRIIGADAELAVADVNVIQAYFSDEVDALPLIEIFHSHACAYGRAGKATILASSASPFLQRLHRSMKRLTEAAGFVPPKFYLKVMMEVAPVGCFLWQPGAPGGAALVLAGDGTGHEVLEGIEAFESRRNAWGEQKPMHPEAWP